MTDQLFVQRLALKAHIGVTAVEQAVAQPLFLDLNFSANVAMAARHDCLVDTIDYDALSQAIIQFVLTHRFQLIETLVERLAAWLLNEFGLSWVRLVLRKPQALGDAECAGVMIERALV